MGNYHYIDQGYAIIAAEGESPHHFGGAPYHDGAICPICKIPLLLLADFDCKPLRELEKKKPFTELDRLPLYYCWKCCAEKFSYQIRGNRVQVFQNLGKPQGEDFPYEDFPRSFPKRAVKIEPIRYDLAKLLAVAQEIGDTWLNETDREIMRNGLAQFRHPHFPRSSLVRHQIGGLLHCVQGHEYVQCSNPECKYHKWKTRISELAVLHNDPHSGLPMGEQLDDLEKPTDFDDYIQVVYWVCEECLTLTASNRCD